MKKEAKVLMLPQIKTLWCELLCLAALIVYLKLLLHHHKCESASSEHFWSANYGPPEQTKAQQQNRKRIKEPVCSGVGVLRQPEWRLEDQRRAESHAANMMRRCLEWVSSGSRLCHYPAEGPLGDYSLLARPWAVGASLIQLWRRG